MPEPVLGRVVEAADKLSGLKGDLWAVVRHDGWLEVLVEHPAVVPPLVAVLHEGQIPVPSDAVCTELD